MKPLCILLGCLLVSACHHDEPARGPFERAGAGVDRAANKTGHALSKAAKKTGDAVEKAGQATGRAFVKVGDKLSGKGTTLSEARPASEAEKKPQ